jgi:hypothetical protein
VIFLLALIPATGIAIAGYFVLYLSARSEGTMRCFGRYLGFWAFTLAGLVILGSLFAAAEGGARRAMMNRGGPGFMMRRPGFMTMHRFGNRFPPPPGQVPARPPVQTAPQAAPGGAPAVPSAPAGL